MSPTIKFNSPQNLENYLQALSDYVIGDVIEKILNINLEISLPEAELITALLIKQLSKAITPEIISSYLQAIGNNDDFFNAPITLEYPESLELPNLSEIPKPNYYIGTKVRLIPIDGASEWGTLIGYYLCYAPHCCKWMWKYMLWLDKSSPSADWVKVTFAWSDEIEGVYD